MVLQLRGCDLRRLALVARSLEDHPAGGTAAALSSRNLRADHVVPGIQMITRSLSGEVINSYGDS
jgi:hypothetical protein